MSGQMMTAHYEPRTLINLILCLSLKKGKHMGIQTKTSRQKNEDIAEAMTEDSSLAGTLHTKIK